MLDSVTRKKLPNVYKNDFTRKMIDFDTLPKTVGDLGKLILAIGFKNLPKVNKSPHLVTLNVD